jgi:cytochrome c oxidase subunit 2
MNLLAAAHQGFFFPKQASSIAPSVDWLMWLINGVAVFFTVGIILVTIWFAFRYRESRNPVPEPAGHNNALEIIWTVIPSIIVLVIFFFGFRGYMEMVVPPTVAHDVKVRAFMWGWSFEYKNPVDGASVITDKLYLPKGEPVILTMSSADVIHSLYLPAFRMKKDVVPGRFNRMWITATEFPSEESGGFDLYCTEYCGTLHSKMLTKAIVLEPADYRAKLIELGDVFVKDGQPLPLAQVGESLATARGCFACHSVDGTRGTGPTWKDLYMHTGQLTDGSAYVADDNYILESIYYPGRKVVAGFGNAMASYLGQLSEREVGAIIEYMKTISVHYKDAAAPVPETAPQTN